jgi:hypothetical protein
VRISIGGVKKIYDLPLIPDMVAGSKNVNAHVKEIFGQLRSDSEPSRRVFSVRKHEIDSVFFH